MALQISSKMLLKPSGIKITKAHLHHMDLKLILNSIVFISATFERPGNAP